MYVEKFLLIATLSIWNLKVVEASCDPHPAPANGQVSYGVRGVGKVARYQCDQGYKLQGNPFSICLDGIWRQPPPTCVINHENLPSFTIKLEEKILKTTDHQKKDEVMYDEPQKVTKKKKRKHLLHNNKIRKGKKKRKRQNVNQGNFEERRKTLDLSCLLGGQGLFRAPDIQNATVKYTRKRNNDMPFNRYLVATYTCNEGFQLKRSDIDKLYCSENRWIGARPKCLIKTEKTDMNELKSRCDVNKGGCEHLCQEVQEQVVCSCYAGYQLNKTSCVDIDECENNNGNCQYNCTNTLGSYVCQCPGGLQLTENGKNCIDINECLGRNGHGPCDDVCNNFWGGYSCSCEGLPGSQLAEDGHACESVDECKAGTLGCSHICVTSHGRSFCQCPQGWELGEDWKTCQDINECEDESLCEFGCINNPGSYSCLNTSTPTSLLVSKPAINCIMGYELNDQNTCIDIDECERNIHNCSHDCINRPGGFECGCPEGFDLSDDEISCEDYNECEEENDEGGSYCSHQCINEIGSFHCDCPNGHILQSDRRTCQKALCNEANCTHDCIDNPNGFQCICPGGFLLQNTTICIAHDNCLSTPCSHYCSNEIGGFKCSCPTDMHLTDNTICVKNSYCLPNPCSHICNENETNFYCTCPVNFDLVNSTTCKEMDTCLSNPCSHFCQNNGTTFECSCPEGMQLANKTTCELIDYCESNPCSHLCKSDSGGFFCSCPDGFQLVNNSFCTISSDCTSNPCSHFCDNSHGTVKCSCPDGYELIDNVTCIDIDECQKEECSQKCINTVGSYQCFCDEGFHQTNGTECVDINECEERELCSHDCINIQGGFFCDCPPGFQLSENNRTCSDFDECEVDNGDCSHTCINKVGSYICACPNGYELESNNKTCVDTDECTAPNLNCSHTCTNLPGSFECKCPDGYKLLGKYACVDFDECLEDGGGCSHNCINHEGSFACACPLGFYLNEDGLQCMDVDECLQNNGNCSHTCKNIEGSYSCICPNGYTLQETNCVDINECRDNNEIDGGCSDFCLNTPGSYQCECRQGYQLADDGKSCNSVQNCSLSNGGCSHTCTMSDAGITCHCPAGWILIDSKKCVESCEENNGGCKHLCTEQINHIFCSCYDNYLLSSDNKTCIPLDEYCDEGYVYDYEQARCICPVGYQLDKNKCEDIDECENWIIHTNSLLAFETHHRESPKCDHLCINQPGNYSCACHDGYVLNSHNNHSCVDVNECNENNGNCSDQCHNTAGGYFCDCKEGYRLGKDNKTCEDIDECQSGISQCTYECRNFAGSFECLCPVGQELTPNSGCHDINECFNENGGCSHLCVNTLGSYHCACPDGYNIDGKQCFRDKNPCDIDNGGCEQVCENNNGHALCSCFVGFKIDNGTRCEDIDECKETEVCKEFCNISSNSSNCSDCVSACKGACVNTKGSYFCTCPDGYFLDNLKCIDKNECNENNGGCSHNCINTLGSYYCSCPDNGCQLVNKTCVSNHQCDECNKQNENIYSSSKCECPTSYVLASDKKTCIEADNRCIAPGKLSHGEIRCPYESQFYPLGTECSVKCRKGFTLTGIASKICGVNGVWEGGLSECVELPCAKLHSPEHGHFIPTSCTIGKSPVPRHCILACDKGFRIQGRAVLTCSSGQKWNRPIPSCVKHKPPAYVYCPSDIISEVPKDQNFVHMEIPRPNTNVDWNRNIEAEPAWAKSLRGDFLLGITSVVFRVVNQSTTASCRLLVIVEDHVRPIVENCPKSFEVHIAKSESSRAIFWKEPTFLDNVGIDHVIKTKEPGCTLPIGRHLINYYAIDTSGNRAECSFHITLKQINFESGSKSFRDVFMCPYLISRTRIVSTFLVHSPCGNQQRTTIHPIRHSHDRQKSLSKIYGTRDVYPSTLMPEEKYIKNDLMRWERTAVANTGASKEDELWEQERLKQQKRYEDDLEKWEKDVKNYNDRVREIDNVP